MSWFEPGAFASLAKNAIKEAQKTIDKALDIHEEETTQDAYGAVSPVIKRQLKEESESFFTNFGLSDKTENIGLTEDSSHSEAKKIKEENAIGGKMVGSLWGSFTGSFFENPKNDIKEKSSSRASSAPITPSDKVVATQPPRSISSLPQSSQVLSIDDSSRSSSIIQLSVDNVSSDPGTGLQSPFLEEVEEPPIGVEDSSLNAEYGNDSREVGWEWGWESSIMVMSSDSKCKEDSTHFKNDSQPQEDSLVDDALDTEGFAKSRLIVGSVDSESSSHPRESLNSLNSSKSLPEIDSLVPVVVEEVFVDMQDVPCLHIETRSLLMEGRDEDESLSWSQPLGLSYSPNGAALESPDSIILLDSSIASPVEPSAASYGPSCRPYLLSVPLTEDVSLTLAPKAASRPDSPTSPSSIEVISGTSTEVSSPTTHETSSYTLSEHSSNSTSNTKTSSDSDEKRRVLVDDPNSATPENAWKTSQDSEMQAITRQPMSSVGKKIHDDENVVMRMDQSLPCFGAESRVGSLSEEAKESFHNSTASSSTLTIMESGEAFDSAESSQTSLITTTTAPATKDHENLVVSMNAGEIRKNLDKVDKEPGHDASLNLGNVKEGENAMSLIREEEPSTTETSLRSVSILEMSSRSESSTETVTASMDSQHMAWSDIGSIETQPDESESTKNHEEEVETEVRDRLQEAMDENLQSKSGTREDKKDQSDIRLGSDDCNKESSTSVDRELSPSSSDRSDAMKVGSSGHSSADEMETATSSDIEVISSPSIDGSSNGNSRSSFGVPSAVAAKVWMTAPRGLRTFINEKAEAMTVSVTSHSSGSNNRKDNGNGHQGETVPSSMTTSFTSISESEGDSPHLPHSELLQLEASRITQILLQDISAIEKGHRRNKSNLSETSESSSEPQTPEMEKLLKKINHLTEILESRETKVLELSHLNATLQDANTALKSRLDELECLRKGSESPECLREEFTQRLVAMERKFQQALREKETIKKQLEEYKAEVASRRNHADVSQEIEDRETIIAELRKEGEKLSKQQLNYSNIVKKLRAKERESDALIQEQKGKIESLSTDLERLRKQMKAKEDVERRQIDAIRQLTVATQRQEEDVKTTKAENAELEGKLSALKEALDTAYREMSELQRSAATKDAEAQKAALSAEISARQKVEAAMAEEQKKSKREQDALLAQIHELQDAQTRAEAQSNRKERQLKGEIQDLLQRLLEAEFRTNEISNSVSAATRPLLRQMENIQASQMVQQAAWEGMEESLTKRLNEAQNAASLSAKREREANENLTSAMTEISSLQSQVAALQTENAQLKTKLEVFTLKTTSLEEAKMREAHQLEALKTSFADEIKEVKHERDILEQQLEIERTAANAEKKKSAAYQEQLKEKDRKLAQLQLLVNAAPAVESRVSTPRSSPTLSLSRLSLAGSMNDSFVGSHLGMPAVDKQQFWILISIGQGNVFQRMKRIVQLPTPIRPKLLQDDVFDPSWTWSGHRSGSLYDTMRGNNAATVDVLTSTLRQREGEVHHLQSELARLEAQKESMAQELVQSSRQSEEYLQKAQELEVMKEARKDMEQKYNALLQMYGEKVEEVEELRLDLEDVKEMYKLQIDQLMQK